MVGHYICRVRVSKNFKLRFLSSKKQKKRSLTAREAADVFCDSNATLAQIGANVLNIALLNGGKDTDHLSSLHYTKCMKIAFTTSSVKPEKLPHT